MIENELIRNILGIALVQLAFLLLVVFYRVWKGENLAERLLAVDVLTSLLISLCVIIALLEGTDRVIDVGIILAALGFVGTLSIARYIAEGRVF